jgi:hypothetical protein
MRKEKGERRKEKGERRKEKGERRKEKGERRKEKEENACWLGAGESRQLTIVVISPLRLQ